MYDTKSEVILSKIHFYFYTTTLLHLLQSLRKQNAPEKFARKLLLNITKTKILKHPLKINIHEKYIPCKFKVGKKFVDIIRLLGKTTKIRSMRAVHAKQLARRSCFLMKRCKFIFVDESRQRFFLCETKLKK